MPDTDRELYIHPEAIRAMDRDELEQFKDDLKYYLRFVKARLETTTDAN